MMEGWMYILLCNDATYYTGSTNNLVKRILQHENGEGANYTAKRLPIKLIYIEKFMFVHEAFYREKQIQGWSRKKKEALMKKEPLLLETYSIPYRDIKLALTSPDNTIPKTDFLLNFVLDNSLTNPEINELLDLIHRHR